MCDHRRLIRKEMNRLIAALVMMAIVYSCAPKLSSTSDTGDYSEDVSDYRPKAESVESAEELKSSEIAKGPYVAPTNSINADMSVIMDSIIYHNRSKAYFTYTVLVYTGRSREEANLSREQVYRLLPDEEPDLIYKQPSYKVNVGRYFDRIEAYKSLMKLREVFPSAALVMEQNYIE